MADDPWVTSRFAWSLFTGRVRTRVLAGALVLAVALSYGGWAARRLGQRGSERQTFDHALVSAAGRIVQRPDRVPDVPTTTTLELELAAVARDQQDLLFGITVLLLRLVVTGTVAGVGLILLTAGSTEWELRSADLRMPPTPRPR